MKSVTMKLLEHQNHIGHCQLTFTSKNDKGEKLVYCLQNHHGNDVRLMRCAQDGEPCHEVSFTKVRAIFERPVDGPYDSEYATKLKKMCNEWIDKYERSFNESQ